MALRRCLTGFSLIVLTAFLAALIGNFLGLQRPTGHSHWQELCLNLEVTDIPAFVRVAYIHNASYLGGLLGLILALLSLFRLKKRR